MAQRNIGDSAVDLSFDLYQAVFEQGVHAQAILDEKLRIQRANKTFLRLFHFSTNETKNPDFTTILDQASHAHYFDPCELYRASTELRTGQRIRLEVFLRSKKPPYNMTIDRITKDRRPLYLVQIHDPLDMIHSEQSLLRLSEELFSYTGKEYLDRLVGLIGEILESDFVFIGEYQGDSQRVQTLSVSEKGVILPNFEYSLKGTPCSVLRNEGLCTWASGIQKLFPEDPMLGEMGLESYAGASLYNSRGHPIGILVAMGTHPIKNTHLVRQILRFSASRACVELERLQNSNDLAMAFEVFEDTSEAIMITNGSNQIIATNPAFTKITGYTSGEILGQTPKILKSGRHDSFFYTRMWNALMKDGAWQGEIWNRRKSGEIYPEWLSITTIRDSAGRIVKFISLFSDISDRKASELRIEKLAHYDEITDLPNRTLIKERLDQVIEQAASNQSEIAVFFIDLDDFKLVNDSLGHHVGDRLLAKVGERIRSCVRDSDLVGRLGGDEFIVILPNARPQNAINTARRLLQANSETYEIMDHSLRVTASIGISSYPQDGTDSLSLLKSADQAMYHSKRARPGSFCFFDQSMNTSLLERVEIESGLRNALQKKELLLHYQPQFDILTGQAIGCEALIRWNHPVRGMLLPQSFIHLAEDSGLIDPLGEWIIREACNQSRLWRKTGITNIPIAINVSPRQLSSPEFPRKIESILIEEGVHPHSIELEITENLSMISGGKLFSAIHDLHQSGFRLSIDDFGTGYSSLGYMKRFRLHKLKIDQSFIRGLPDNQDDSMITETIITLARNFRMNVVAEGVETMSQLNFLRERGCTVIQGFLLSRPVPPEELSLSLPMPVTGPFSGI